MFTVLIHIVQYNTKAPYIDNYQYMKNWIYENLNIDTHQYITYRQLSIYEK